MNGDILRAAREFLQCYKTARMTVIPHPDTDGLSGAALILERLGLGIDSVLCPDKGISVHAPEFRGGRLTGHDPEALVVIDQGSRSGALLPGVPTLTIDHHWPSGIPEGLYLTSYPVETKPDEVVGPVEPASLLCHHIVGNPQERLWVAALGCIADYGAQADFPEVTQARSQFGGNSLKEAAALVNAARRSSLYDWPTALAAILEATSPQTIASLQTINAQKLDQYRTEVRTELMQARRTRPRFAGPWAVLAFASPCLVHGPVASAWARRLSKNIVVAANLGYRPGFIHFSVRSQLNVNLIAALRSLAPEGLPGEWGHGHHRATGGAVPREEFALLLARMGFSDENASDILGMGKEPVNK